MRVALGLALVQSDRASNPQFIGLKAQFRRVVRPPGMAPNPQFNDFEVRFDDLLRKSTCYFKLA